MTDVVIPAWNEETTLPSILRVLTTHDHIDRVIVVVDEETTDDTAVKAKEFTSWVHAGYHGKGQNVMLGLSLVQSEHVMFCDADYSNLTHKHVDTMLNARGYEWMTIGVPEFPVDVPARVISAWPWVSGIRIMPTEMPLAVTPELHGYLTEVQLNKHAAQHGYHVAFKFLPGLWSPFLMTPRRVQERELDRAWGMREGVLPR